MSTFSFATSRAGPFLTGSRVFPQKLDKALCAAVPEMTSEQVWKHVYYINSYHVGWSVEQGMLMSKTLKKYMGDHRPAGTGVGVKNLAYPECLLEVALYAAVPN